MEITADQQAKLEEAFKSHGVRVAYLFGSQATGRARPDSDIDIAALMDEGVPSTERFDHRLLLMHEIGQVFRTDSVDVVVLNDVTPLLRMEVMRDGRLLYSDDEELRTEFHLKVLREYWDTEWIRRLIADTVWRRIDEGTFGRHVTFVPIEEKTRK